MTHQQYQQMCLRVLENHTWYKPITLTLVQEFILEFHALYTQAFWEGLIDKDILAFLNVKTLHTSTFYSLTKTLKNMHTPPGRPIVSGMGSLMENTSKYMDAFLMHHVLSLPTYKRDITDLLKHIEGIQVPLGYRYRGLVL